jgi:inner membrane protein
VAVEEIWHIGIYDRLMQNSNILRMIAGIAGFLVLSAFGKVQPHRSFMHSIVALFLMSWCVHIFFPPAMPYFAVGFASHLAIDLLNKKREQLFWPVKKGISFGVCSASGTVNQIMMVIGSLCAAGLFLYLLWHCCFPG